MLKLAVCACPSSCVVMSAPSPRGTASAASPAISVASSANTPVRRRQQQTPLPDAKRRKIRLFTNSNSEHLLTTKTGASHEEATPRSPLSRSPPSLRRTPFPVSRSSVVFVDGTAVHRDIVLVSMSFLAGMLAGGICAYLAYRTSKVR